MSWRLKMPNLKLTLTLSTLRKTKRFTACMLLTSSCLTSLVGCATPAAVRIIAPCPAPPEAPTFLQTPPPEPNFQLRLRNFFLSSPETPTLPPVTPISAEATH